MPTVKFDSKAEQISFELIPNGDYAFEIVAVDFTLSKGAKTAGCEQMEAKVAIFTDATFQKKRAQWTETFIFHDSTAWKLSVFAKAANMLNNGQPYNDGDEIDYSEATVVGLRGLCSVGTEEYQPTGGGEKRKKNKIIAWLTENPKQARNMAMVKAAEPSSETPAPDDDDLPF